MRSPSEQDEPPMVQTVTLQLKKAAHSSDALKEKARNTLYSSSSWMQPSTPIKCYTETESLFSLQTLPKDVYLSVASCSGQQKATLGQRHGKKGQDQKTTPGGQTDNRCRIAASSLLMSQCSESENMRIFMAERMWA